MQVLDAFNELAYGELNGHSLCIRGSIEEKDYKKVIYFLNTGLLDLYTKYPLLTKELTLVQKSWITQYALRKEHAESDPTEAVKYIKDSVIDPFLGDVIRVEEVVDENGDVLELNSTDYDKVALTSSMDVLEIPNPTEGNALFVTYRAKHPLLTDLNSNILLPTHMLQALYAYVCTKAYAGSTSPEHLNKSSEMTNRYATMCSKLEADGMVNAEQQVINIKPEVRGWV